MKRSILLAAVLCGLFAWAAQAQTTRPAQTAQSRKLFKAVQEGKFDILKTIIEAEPALVSARDSEHGATPLHHAATVEIAAYLLDNGAELEALDQAHWATPLRWAADDQHRKEVAKFLRGKGAKVEDLPLAIAL